MSEDSWLINEPRLKYIAIGIIFTIMFGLFAMVLFRVGGLVWLAMLMCLIALASIATSGYNRSILLNRAGGEVRIQHTIYLWKWERIIPLEELEEVGNRSASTQSHHLVYYVTLVGKKKKISLLRKDKLEDARTLQEQVATFLDLPQKNFD